MNMKVMIVPALALTLLGTGCATKKFVTKTVAPVEQRVSGAETKNVEQDKTEAAQATQIEGVDRSLSQTKELLTDTAAKATQAEASAKIGQLYI